MFKLNNYKNLFRWSSNWKNCITSNVQHKWPELCQRLYNGFINLIFYYWIFLKTQGAEISSKITSYENKNKDIELFFFDIGGQELYKNFVPELVKNHYILLFDKKIGERCQFNHAGFW